MDDLSSAGIKLLAEKAAESYLPLLGRRLWPVMRPWATIFMASAFGTAMGWFAHTLLSGSEAQRPCREEVISVDGARGPVSCSHADQMGELKDGYLVCKCKKK
jgi:hypothetical protein